MLGSGPAGRRDNRPVLSGDVRNPAREPRSGVVNKERTVIAVFDAEAVARVLAGDLEAFAELVERHDRSIWACLHNIVGNAEDTRDLKAECWESIFVKLREYDPSRDFRKWAVGFARKLGCAALRHRKSLPRMVGIEFVPERRLPTVSGPQDEHERLLAEEEARAIVAPLPREQQMAVLCHGCDGMSYKELARLTGRKPGTIQSDYRRGLETLRRLRE